ncbi:hypothetical protein [Methylobacterium planeticum]|uniref:Uncharacterized protein n=1 Tax=Methylobacterium planeticum TaxID=2615211 RepID=A0A6N6MRQ6_9HYPH|nr:hypothetical protein [Methylobacterium planeticum]KAB1072179.1 hypothetical protein F6X51_17305 [Methylobacterium planeticum]
MSRLAQVVVTLVLFSAVMAGAAALLKVTLLPGVSWLSSQIGIEAVLAIEGALISTAYTFGYWPRTGDGRLRSLRSFWD